MPPATCDAGGKFTGIPGSSEQRFSTSLVDFGWNHYSYFIPDSNKGKLCQPARLIEGARRGTPRYRRILRKKKAWGITYIYGSIAWVVVSGSFFCRKNMSLVFSLGKETDLRVRCPTFKCRDISIEIENCVEVLRQSRAPRPMVGYLVGSRNPVAINRIRTFHIRI